MSKQYTIRNIDLKLDAKLRAKAARERKSLNNVVIQTLANGLRHGSSKSVKEHDDFGDLAGSWIDDPDFDAAMSDMRQVDDRDWR